jgi:hypothetical protein
MKLVLSQSSVMSQPELVGRFLVAASDDVRFLRGSYPEFDEWLRGKVIPGIVAGERTVILEMRNGGVAGLLIVKHTDAEKKLCTLRVRPEYESKGLGIRLFETAFDILGTERPLLSVSEPSMPKFSRLFAHFGFSQEAVYGGLYVPHVDELSYNGYLESSCTRRAPTVQAATQRGLFLQHA